MTEGLFRTGIIPLVIRLVTGRADRVVTRDVRNLAFRSAIPGGFASCELQLDRPLSLDPDEIQLYGDLYIYDGRNGSTIWQGRLEDPGRGAGKKGEVWTVRAVGPAAHARDRTVKLIYVDKSLERWPLMGISASVESQPGGESQMMTESTDDPGIRLRAIEGATLPGANWRCGHHYRELNDSGQALARVSFNWDVGATMAWMEVVTTVRVGIAGAFTVATTSLFNIAGGTHVDVVATDFPADRDVAEIYINYNAGGGAVGTELYWAEISDVVVMAQRYTAAGVLRVAAGNYPLDTVLASEVVADLLGRLLDQYDGANASIGVTAFAIDQLAYPDGTTPEKVLADLMAIETDFYWAAWEGSPARFEWRSWPATIRYEADAKDGFASPASAVELFNRVTVRWRGHDGRLRATVRTSTVPALDAAGLTREAFINLADEVGSGLLAAETGDTFLAEHSSAPNAGTLRVSTPIFDNDAGREVDPWEIRPGHLIRVRDVLPRVDALNATSRDAVTIFKIVAVNYNADNNTARLELDSRPVTVTSLMRQMKQDMTNARKR